MRHRALDEIEIDLWLASTLQDGLEGIHPHLLHETQRLATAGLAQDGTALGIRSAGIDLHGLEGQRIRDQHVTGRVDQYHRIVGEGRIEVGRRRVAALGQHVLVVALPDQRVAGAGLHVGLELAQRLDDVGDLRHAADGGRVEVGLHQRIGVVEQMAVAVDEPRQQRLSRKVDLGRAGTCGLVHLGARADGEDLAIPHRERLRVGRLGPRHGEDVAAGVDRDAVGRRRGARLAAGTEHERRGRDGEPCGSPLDLLGHHPLQGP